MSSRWCQLDHMQVICTLLQTDNHASTSSLVFSGSMLFLPSSQQHQSTEGTIIPKYYYILGDLAHPGVTAENKGGWKTEGSDRVCIVYAVLWPAVKRAVLLQPTTNTHVHLSSVAKEFGVFSAICTHWIIISHASVTCIISCYCGSILCVFVIAFMTSKRTELYHLAGKMVYWNFFVFLVCILFVGCL